MVLLVFGRFMFLCFLVECAEASWLLEVSFHGIFYRIVSVTATLEMHIVILVAQNLSFGRPGAWCLHFDTLVTILAAWRQLGPWEQQEGHAGSGTR